MRHDSPAVNHIPGIPFVSTDPADLTQLELARQQSTDSNDGPGTAKKILGSGSGFSREPSLKNPTNSETDVQSGVPMPAQSLQPLTLNGDRPEAETTANLQPVSHVRWQRVLRCVGESVLAVIVGVEFGALSVEDAAAWVNYLYRFIPSDVVNTAGVLVTLQDIQSLPAKLKKDPETGKRDMAVIGPFIPSIVLMAFAVIATLPLAKDASKGLLKNASLSDSSKEVLQIFCMLTWAVGYTAPTRLDGANALLRELYEDTLMKYFQADLHQQVMLARQMKRYPDLAKRHMDTNQIDVNQLIAFTDETQSLPASLLYGVKQAAKMTLMASCLLLLPVLQDTSERGWADLGLDPNGRAVVGLGSVSTASALAFFMRASQLFPDRLTLGFSNMAKSSHYLLLAAAYIAVLAVIAVGSSFGWYFEAEQFRTSGNHYAHYTFKDYAPVVAGLAGFFPNFGFVLGFMNGCFALANKCNVSVAKSVGQKLTGLFDFHDQRSEEDKRFDRQVNALAKGKGFFSEGLTRGGSTYDDLAGSLISPVNRHATVRIETGERQAVVPDV